MYIVMKCYEGSLSDQLRLAPSRKIECIGAMRVIRQLGTALAELHEAGIIHQDIKPSNILFDNHGRYVLADVGISHIMQGTLGASRFMPTSIKGTDNYMPAEAFEPDEFGGISCKVDLWSLGCVLLEMITGLVPFDKLLGRQIRRKVCDRKEHPQIPASEEDRHVCDLLKACFQHEPMDRPTAAEFVARVTQVLQTREDAVQPERQRGTDEVEAMQRKIRELQEMQVESTRRQEEDSSRIEAMRTNIQELETEAVQNVQAREDAVQQERRRAEAMQRRIHELEELHAEATRRLDGDDAQIEARLVESCVRFLLSTKLQKIMGDKGEQISMQCMLNRNNERDMLALEMSREPLQLFKKHRAAQIEAMQIKIQELEAGAVRRQEEDDS